MRSVSYRVALQLLSRVMSFALNTFILRSVRSAAASAPRPAQLLPPRPRDSPARAALAQVSRDVVGISTMHLEVLLAWLTVVPREGVRSALLRVDVGNAGCPVARSACVRQVAGALRRGPAGGAIARGHAARPCACAASRTGRSGRARGDASWTSRG